MSSVNRLVSAGLGQIGRSWGSFLVFGILLIVLGSVCVVKSESATTFSILALGWVLAISAVLWLVTSFYSFSWQGFFIYLLNAIIRGTIGYLLIRHPDAGAEGVTMLLAALFVVNGLFRGFGASLIQFPRWGWTFISGLISAALGIYLIATWPSASTFFFGLAIGIDLICDGAALVGLATAIHALPETLDRAA